MKTIKNKISKLIESTNGLPNYTLCEYLDVVRNLLYQQLTYEEIRLIKKYKINLDAWIIEATTKITTNLL